MKVLQIHFIKDVVKIKRTSINAARKGATEVNVSGSSSAKSSDSATRKGASNEHVHGR